ncbi:hypothetical protein FA95DRAFT_1600708 [Auriscalpium vulgare]|uniref:Uncharacterized protein n=1 Tax=Auriscalpium vulgare TaxID=40419 RepID=A0ACB8SCA6_9AGAM|nr:hypothetical protein FA95DRAFT_1600708 [Auriscalpium vulgare]
MDPTAAYRRRVPDALHAVSPALAAFHAARAHSLHPDIPARPLDRCPKCGSLHDPAARVRPIRHANKGLHRSRPGAPRRLQSTCAACAHVDSMSLEHDNASLYPRVRGRALRNAPAPTYYAEAPLPDPPRSSEGLAPRSVSSPLAPASAVHPPASRTPPSHQAKKPRTKKSGLQEMLARNRERQQGNPAKDASSSGLAGFLTEL